MRYISITLLSLFIFSNAYAFDDEGKRSWQIIGIKSDRFLGKSAEDNKFKNGYGLCFEFGFDDASESPGLVTGLAAGTSFYSTSNHVGKDKIDADFYVPIYLEWRHYHRKFSNIAHFSTYGLALNRMHLETLNTAEYHLMLSFGIVEQYLTGSDRIIQLSLKPYFVFFNDLGQIFGFEFNLAYGFAQH